MKYFCSLFLLAGLAGCTDSAPKKANQPQVMAKDSTIIRSEQANPYVAVDLSPMDMSYLPADYPILKMTGKTAKLPVARVIYSRPHRQGRKIFGNLLKYGEPWRLGANEATELELFEPIQVEKKTVPKGRYTLYCIPQADKWRVLLNSNLYNWGLKQDSTKNLYEFDAPVQVKNQTVEYFTMDFEKTGNGKADLVMAWDDVEVRLPIEYNEK